MTSLNQHFTVDVDLLNQTLLMIQEWDFSLTKQKLSEAEYAGWTTERSNKAELDYKRYLALTKVSKGFQPVPNGDIDRFWHEHILDTRRYAQDCEVLFGTFLHHYPFFGMRGDVDNDNWLSAIEYSNFLWRQAFGEDLYSSDSQAMKCPQKCPASPLPMKCPQRCPA